MAWAAGAGAVEGAAANAGSRATTPVTAVDVEGRTVQEFVGVVPAAACDLVAIATCELRESFTEAPRDEPLGGWIHAGLVALPWPNTRRSPACVVVTLVGASPLPAPPESIGWDWFTPLNAIVTIDT